MKSNDPLDIHARVFAKNLPANNSRKVTQIMIASPGLPLYGRQEIRGKDTTGDFSPMVLHLVRYDRVWAPMS